MGEPESNAKSNVGDEESFGRRLLSRIKTAIYAPPKKDPSKAQLRIGMIGGDIPVYPPLAFLLLSGGGLLGWFFSGSRMRYLPKGIASSLPLRCTLGAAIVMCSGKLAKACRAELEKFGTKSSFQPVVKICDTGPYSYGRNLMYVAILGIPSAGSVVLDTAWLLYSCLGLGSYLNFIVIPAEEKMLRTEFGKGYEDYCRRVPRWFRIFK
jgi:protein-S-isoprenylcysteine O-methyltransferase Ste14